MGILLICQKAMVRVCGAWIRIDNVLYSKIYSTLGGMFWNPTGSRRATRGACICETCLLVGAVRQPAHHQAQKSCKVSFKRNGNTHNIHLKLIVKLFQYASLDSLLVLDCGLCCC